MAEISVTASLCALNGHQPILETTQANTVPMPITCGCGAQRFEYVKHPLTNTLLLSRVSRERDAG